MCSSLKNVTLLGSAIRSIDKGAFEGCYSLETITLPSSMTLIGERCFEGCPSIKEINSDAVTPPEVSESSFVSDISFYFEGGMVMRDEVYSFI